MPVVVEIVGANARLKEDLRLLGVEAVKAYNALLRCDRLDMLQRLENIRYIIEDIRGNLSVDKEPDDVQADEFGGFKFAD
jgi:hypothetical protein